MARLPDAVVAAFQSPLDIQFRWAAPLTEAIQKDPEGVLARARAIREDRGDLSAAKILAKLIGADAPATVEPGGRPMPIKRAGKVAAKLSLDAKGRVLIAFEANVVDATKHRALAELIEGFLNTAT